MGNLLLNDIPLHHVHRLRLMLLSRMGIAENHIDLGVAQHRRQRYKVNSSLSGTGMSVRTFVWRRSIEEERREEAGVLVMGAWSIDDVIELFEGRKAVAAHG
jgi:hypothetical protein